MKPKNQEQRFMAGLLEEFKEFVIDSMEEGMDTMFDDHYDFLKACLDTFQDMNESEPDLRDASTKERDAYIEGKYDIVEDHGDHEAIIAGWFPLKEAQEKVAILSQDNPGRKFRVAQHGIEH